MSIKLYFKIKNFYLISLLGFFNTFTNTPIILLDPSCNLRTVATEYENNVAFLYCQSVQNYLNENQSNYLIQLSRTAYDQYEENAIANISNKLQPKIHISLHFTSTQHTPTINIYYFSWNVPNQTNIVTHTRSSLSSCIPASQAYTINLEKSKEYANKCYNFFNKEYGKNITLHKPIGCPFKPLAHIITPALAIEFDIETLEHSEVFQEMFLSLIESLIEEEVL